LQYQQGHRNSYTIHRLLRHKVYTEFYPLHDGSHKLPLGTMEKNLRAKLDDIWVNRWFRRQPLDEIRVYFGEKIALYFAWLGKLINTYSILTSFPRILCSMAILGSYCWCRCFCLRNSKILVSLHIFHLVFMTWLFHSNDNPARYVQLLRNTSSDQAISLEFLITKYHHITRFLFRYGASCFLNFGSVKIYACLSNGK
jgi:hypothetical protein